MAGLFYPDDPELLRASVERCLAEGASTVPAGDRPWKALVAPHAGFVYSGPVAGHAHARLAPRRDAIRRVVLLGPSHRVAFRGIAASTADGFATPLGVVPVDREATTRALGVPGVRAFDAAHAEEHSLEVQLPFLQVALRDFAIVPLVVGDAAPEAVAALIEALWDGDETVVVVSSDLSHYLPYEAARRLDRATSDAIERLAPAEIGEDRACGRRPVQGLLVAARRHGLGATTFDLRSSGDTAGGRDAVVGYGAYGLR